MHQQIISFEKLYPYLNDNGVYLCEDTHTSYWHGFGGGLKKPESFIEYSKNFIDLMHAHYNNQEIYSDIKLPLDFRQNTFCISYYDSIVVLDKKIDTKTPTALIME